MASALIALALQLILAAQGPNVPLSLKTEALQVATIAIQAAETSSNAPTQTAPIATQNDMIEPVFSGIGLPLPTCILSSTTTILAANDLATISWQTQNADSGIIENGNRIMAPIASGTVKNISVGKNPTPIIFNATVTNSTGTGNCQTDVERP